MLARTRRRAGDRSPKANRPSNPASFPPGACFRRCEAAGAYRARLFVTGTDGVHVENTIDFTIE
jgi:hypothetical protein